MKILAIGAHPDDIEIFMFGFLCTCLDRGDDIFISIATDGSLGGKYPGPMLAEERMQETSQALIKFGKPIFLNFLDGSLNTHPNAQIKITKLIHNIMPDLILTHAPEDYHPDHRALSEYVKNAAGFQCPILFSDTLMGVNFIPEYYVDITPYFRLKQEAILTHYSQNPKRFLEATKILNRFRSAQCNAPNGHYAEAYRYEKTFPFSDIRDLLPPAPKYQPYYKNLKGALI